jgi:pyruvate carboxylase subunit B
MRYVVQVNGERINVERDGDTVALDGVSSAAQLEEVEGTPVRLVRIGSEVHRVVVQRRGGRGIYTLWIDGYRYEVEALDERARAIRDLTAATAAPAGPSPLVAPMPGLVVRVKVTVGDVVKAGQGLVVMEAMKMENELRTHAAGTVRAVRATPGTAVEKGAVLVELE